MTNSAIRDDALCLVSELQRAGFTFREGPDGRLLVSPASRLTEHQRGRVALMKSAILDVLGHTPHAPRQPPVASHQLPPEYPPAVRELARLLLESYVGACRETGHGGWEAIADQLLRRGVSLPAQPVPGGPAA